MDRTLYLNENKKLRVFRDGPSIWIKEEGKAGRRIPARLVSRVVIIGNIKLESGVITLFTDNDVPITFLNHRGDAVAVAMPYNHHLPRHYDEQKKFLENEENIERFKNWLYSKKKEVQLGVIKRISKRTAEIFSEKGFREKDYKKFIEEFKPPHLFDEKFKVVYRTVSNLFREMVIGCIVRADLDPHLGVYYRRHNFGFALDICYALDSEIEMQTIQFLKIDKDKGYIVKEPDGWIISKEGMRDIVHRFENRRKQIQEKIESLLDDIFELMRDIRK
ncbi:MAG: CRISPR-associated endonuclease Cas1 [Thermodesulfovibrionales bacterium]